MSQNCRQIPILLLLGSQQNFGDGKVRTTTVTFKLITALLANQ